MLTLTSEEFISKFDIDNKALSKIKREDMITIEIVMGDQTPVNINDSNFNTIVNLNPTDGTHWVLVIRRRAGKVYYFDSFGVETPPLFLKEHVDLGSDERIQEYDESYCGAYCLYMIYLIANAYKIESALNTLVNQVKCPEAYNKCLGCKAKGKLEVNAIVSGDVNVNNKGNVNG